MNANHVFETQVTEGSVCSFHGKHVYKHCGIFGDPHLRTFSDEFLTCKTENTWSLVDNDYMGVMATNAPVKEGSNATVTTKVRTFIVSNIFHHAFV